MELPLPCFFVVLLSTLCFSQTPTDSSEWGGRKISSSENDFISRISNSKDQPAGLAQLESSELPLPIPQPQTQNRDFSPFSNNNFLDNERIREDQERVDRERARERERNQFPFGTTNNEQDSRSPFGRPPRPLDPFSGPTTTSERNFGIGIDPRQRVPDFTVNQRPQTSINPGFNSPFNFNNFRNSVIREP